MSDDDSRTETFHQMLVSMGDTTYYVNGVTVTDTFTVAHAPITMHTHMHTFQHWTPNTFGAYSQN